MKKFFALAAVAGLATSLSIGAAKADELIFGPGTSVTFDSVGIAGQLAMHFPNQSGGSLFLGNAGTFSILGLQEPPGPYQLSGFNGTTFTNITTATGPNVPRSFSADIGAGGALGHLAGLLTWTSVDDNSVNTNTLVGSLAVTASSGVLGAAFPVAFVTPVHWTINGNGISTLEQLSTQPAGAFQTLTTSSGEIQAIPGPIVGAGLPGLIAVLGGLVAMARRRRKQLA